MGRKKKVLAQRNGTCIHYEVIDSGLIGRCLKCGRVVDYTPLQEKIKFNAQIKPRTPEWEARDRRYGR